MADRNGTPPTPRPLVDEVLERDGRLRRPEPVHEETIGPESLPVRLDVLPAHLLPSQHDQAYRGRRRPGRERLDDVPVEGGRRMVDGDAVAAQAVAQPVQAGLADVDRVKGRPVEQGPEDVHDRRVHAVGGEQRQRVIRAEVQVVGVGRDEMQDVAVVLRDTLGPPGRAGRVEEIGEVVRRRGEAVLGRHRAAQDVVDLEHPHRMRHQLGRQGQAGRARQHRGRARVLKDLHEPLTGVRGVERHVRGAGLQDAEDAGYHRRVMVQQQRDPGAVDVRHARERVGDPIGGPVQRVVGPRHPSGADGDPTAMAGDELLEPSRYRLLDFLVFEGDERVVRPYEVAMRGPPDPLVRRENRYGRDGPLGVRHDAFE